MGVVSDLVMLVIFELEDNSVVGVSEVRIFLFVFGDVVGILPCEMLVTRANPN